MSDSEQRDYDEQIAGIDDSEYLEVISGGQDNLTVEVYSYHEGGSVSVLLTPRAARELARYLLAAAEVTEDNNA